jgi:magnesium transporter
MTTTQSQPSDARTFRGHDPDTVLAEALSADTPTRCQARTRLYRNGKLIAQGFPLDDISEYLVDKEHDHSTVIWLDLRNPDREDLGVLSEEFGLHPVAVEDALDDHERPKLDRYGTHLFLAA